MDSKRLKHLSLDLDSSREAIWEKVCVGGGGRAHHGISLTHVCVCVRIAVEEGGGDGEGQAGG